MDGIVQLRRSPVIPFSVVIGLCEDQIFRNFAQLMIQRELGSKRFFCSADMPMSDVLKRVCAKNLPISSASLGNFYR